MYEITEIDKGVQGSGAGEVEVGMLMAESAPSLSDMDSLNSSQLANPVRPKIKGRRGESLGPEIEVGA
jgi:hypothetical protein